ncbi:dUTP diphosphatase [Lysinibacillus sp. NPDC093712]|uniref:dUTP diphosphatase n=1 Tax=Lysinibacillus sp. NPDC093712 TaxID=3390579 RepID=UPI003D05E317
MNHEYFIKQRISLLRQIDMLTESKYPGITPYREIGQQLDENIIAIRALRTNTQPAKAVIRTMVTHQPVLVKKLESEGVKMTQAITVEMYHDFKAQGLIDKAIREKVGLDNNKFYKFKQDNGLIGTYGRQAQSEDKAETTPTLREKSIKTPEIDTNRVAILEKELGDLKSQFKEALTFIESLKTENTALNEQLWGNRLQVLYAKQAELENFIAEKHGLNTQDYLEEQQLSILVELAESANEWQAFKYWKQNKKVNRENLLEETVDVLHLILARGIALGWYVTTIKALKKKSITGQYIALMQTIVTNEESSVTYAIAFNLFAGLVEMLGFTWLEVEAAYAKKHQENIDRQNNDY